MDSLVRLDKEAKKESSHWRYEELNRLELVVPFLRAMVTLDAREPLGRFLKHIVSMRRAYDLAGVHLAAVFDIGKPLVSSTKHFWRWRSGWTVAETN